MPPELVKLIEEGASEAGVPVKLHTMELPPPEHNPWPVGKVEWKGDPEGCHSEM